MKLVTHFFLFFFTTQVFFAQKLDVNWIFETKNNVIASPLIYENIVYVGDESGVFYALSQKSGHKIWQYNTDGIIQAKATIADDIVFFESGNVFYALDRKSGKLQWKFDSKFQVNEFMYQGVKFKNKIDPFDFDHSKAFLYEGVLYIGSRKGILYGFQIKDGKVIVKVSSDESSPIRSSPLVNNGKLFFGDWNGIVYCYDLNNKKMIWKKKTYRKAKPYETFGGINSEFVLYDGLLFFGARNYMLNILIADSGEKEWTHMDSKEGWIWGSPEIRKDTLFIGGSDNFKMTSFNPNNGKEYWSHIRTKNIIGRAIVTDEWVMYTSGNAYDINQEGEFVVLQKKDGKLVDSYVTEKALLSSPSLNDNQIIFSCYNGKVYSFRIN